MFQCSSASRKFLNTPRRGSSARCGQRFQCSSASRKFLNQRNREPRRAGIGFQCSSASRKFLNSIGSAISRTTRDVSVLFSEPKIPQFVTQPAATSTVNVFQCSSASRKFLNSYLPPDAPIDRHGFSALQRAENSSISRVGRMARSPRQRFQCSSASRKFLNYGDLQRLDRSVECFSALQRAENSSISRLRRTRVRLMLVSVLFSEPKIPQFLISCLEYIILCGFSALQRAENSSIYINNF